MLVVQIRMLACMRVLINACFGLLAKGRETEDARQAHTTDRHGRRKKEEAQKAVQLIVAEKARLEEAARQKKAEAAEEEGYREAIRMDPQNAEAHFRLGRLLWVKEQAWLKETFRYDGTR